jgi:Tol biopolymer transport system component
MVQERAHMQEPWKQVVAFASKRGVGLINPEGTDERYPAFDVPGQASWQLGQLFADGRRMIVQSIEDVTMSKLVVGDVQTHTWIYDLKDKSLQEILTQDRVAPYMGCCGLLPGEDRMVVAAIIAGEQRLFTMDLDGSNQSEVTRPGQGFHYGVALSPDGRRLAFHVTSGKYDKVSGPTEYRPGPYAINVCDVDGGNRVVVAGQPDHLYFGPCWSPDGQWLVYLDCLESEDPAHFSADLCIGRPDRSEDRVVTAGQSHWFGATYGPAEARGGGSNTSRWLPDGTTITYTRISPGSHPDCVYHPELPDHEELVYRPELARGCTQLCLLDPFAGDITELTESQEDRWDCRPTPSPDGQSIAFVRAVVGHPSELWIMDSDGGNPRLLTRGLDQLGADHPRWLSLAPGVSL